MILSPPQRLLLYLHVHTQSYSQILSRQASNYFQDIHVSLLSQTQHIRRQTYFSSSLPYFHEWATIFLDTQILRESHLGLYLTFPGCSSALSYHGILVVSSLMAFNIFSLVILLTVYLSYVPLLYIIPREKECAFLNFVHLQSLA